MTTKTTRPIKQASLVHFAALSVALAASMIAARHHENIRAFSTEPSTGYASYFMDAPSTRAPNKASTLHIAGRPVLVGAHVDLDIQADAKGLATIPVVLEAPGNPTWTKKNRMFISTPAAPDAFAWDGQAYQLKGLEPGARYAIRAAFFYRDDKGRTYDSGVEDCAGGCIAAFGAPEMTAPGPSSPLRKAYLATLDHGTTPFFPLAIFAGAFLWRLRGRSLFREGKAALGMNPDSLPLPIRSPKA